MAKKSRQEQLEAALVALMLDNQESFKQFYAELSAKLISHANAIIIEAMKEQPNRFIIQQHLNSIREAQYRASQMFLDGLEEEAEETIDELVRQGLLPRDISIVAVMNAIQSVIDEASDYLKQLINPILFELEGIATGTLQVGASQGKLNRLEQLRDNLDYFTRRHIEAQVSVIHNLAVIEAFKNSVTLYKWSVQPELSMSGPCSVCLGHAHGGMNDEGIYTLETLPLLPVHPHCVCVVVPLVDYGK